MSPYRAVAWDIDGTLVDSEPLHHRALARTCEDLGVDLSDLPDQAFRGVHMLDVWTLLRPRLPAWLKRQAWLEEIDRYYVEHAAELVAMPEALEAVAALATRGVVQACVSNSSRAVVNANLAALGVDDQMAFSISLDDVPAGKPDPAPYRLAARRLGVPPRAILAVEDSAAGAQSARAAGLAVARYGAAREGEGEGDYHVENLTDILSLL